MNLPILSLFKKKSKVDYYLALLIRDEKISAIILEQRDKKLKLVSQREIPLTTPPEQLSIDDFTELTDSVISQTEETLPADAEIRNTVFGVKDNWVEDKKIKKEFLSRLKHVCEQLSLSPIGFIVVSEAISHLIRQEEGAPVTALLTEVGKDLVTVSLFKAGKLIESQQQPITSTAMHAVDESLKKFKLVEILPPRIILSHTTLKPETHKKDELKQQFLAHQWSKSLPFLHVPQVSVLPYGFDGKSIVVGAATQLGFDVAEMHEQIFTDTQTNIADSGKEKPVLHTHQQKEENGSKGENNTEIKSDILHNKKKDSVDLQKEVNTEYFGFVLDKDIATIPLSEHTIVKDSPSKKVTADEISIHPEKQAEFKVFSETEPNRNESDESNIDDEIPAKSRFSLVAFIKNNIKKLQLHSISINKPLLIIPPVIVLIFIALILLYFFMVKATVTILVSPKTVNETEKIALSTTESSNFSQNIIAAKEVMVALDGNVTTNTTGEKEVGEKAKGTITIYNSDETKITFEEGTTVTSEKGLEYIMDKEVNVASASGDIFTGIKSGTAQVPVVAKQIGTEYNLPSNTKFSIKGTNVVAAKNESAFSGGSKKKVSVVTQKDIDKLKAELPKSLESKAKDELNNKIGNDEVLLSGFTKVELSKETLDNDLDKEAKTVKLSGTVTYKAVSYKKDDLLQYAENVIRKQHTQDILSKQSIDVTMSGLKDKNEDEITGVAEINAGLLPKIDAEILAIEFVGKSFPQAKEYARTLSPQVKDVEITLSPNISFLPQMLPRNSKNINVVVQAAK